MSELLAPRKEGKVKVALRRAGREIDRAINLGLISAYPILFSMPAPDPPPDWKQAVRFGWKVTRTVAVEAAKILLSKEKS